jgi:hypothetical protein
MNLKPIFSSKNTLFSDTGITAQPNKLKNRVNMGAKINKS